MEDTKGKDYSERLANLEGKSWKRILNVQAPYKWNLSRLQMGRTLDVGCGIGRNLVNLENSVGVDHNLDSVLIARSKGLKAYSTDEWISSPDAVHGSFDSILLAHVLEHLSEADADQVITSYLPYLKQGGNLVLICPQEKGFPTDPTHIRWVDDAELLKTGTRLGFTEVKNYSFPLPRFAGKLFTYNEFVYVGRRNS